MKKSIIAAFKATAAQAVSAVDTVTQVLFGAASTISIFSMGVDGALTVVTGTGRVTLNPVLQLGGANGVAIFVARLLVNGEQVGEARSISVAAGDVAELSFEEQVDSLSQGDIVTVEYGVDAASASTAGSTIVTTPTAALAGWSTTVPAELRILG